MNSLFTKWQVLAAIAGMACMLLSGCGDEEKEQTPEVEVCTPNSCAEGLICDTASGRCIADENINNCENIEKPEGAIQCKCFEDQWYCIYPGESTGRDLCKDSNCPAGEKCDPNTGDCIPEEVTISDCEGIEQPSGAIECKCFEDQWYCIFPSEPTEPEIDPCKDSNCPAGEKCDPNTGECIPEDTPSSNCEGLEQPAGAEDCQCVENKWYCIYPSGPTEPTEPTETEKDLCKEIKCPEGQACDSKTGKCVAYQTSFLYTEGKNFCTKGTDGKCKKIQLRGFNLGMWLSRSIWGLPINAVKYENGEVQSDVNNLEIWYGLENNKHNFTGLEIHSLSEALYDNFISEEDIDTLKDLGVNLVRVPFEWSHLMLCEQNKQSCVFLSEDDSVLFKHMDWIVDECGKRGIYVIFDLHVAQGNLNTGGHREKAEFLDDVYKNNIIRMWKRISNHYKNNTAVAGYDLVNEPEIDNKYGNTNAKKAEVLAQFYGKIYDVIRNENKDDHIIIMEEECVFCGIGNNSIGYSKRDDIGLLPKPKDMGWNKNVAYSVHNYFWSHRAKINVNCEPNTSYVESLNCDQACENAKKDCEEDNKTRVVKEDCDENKKICDTVCGTNYYECVTKVFFPEITAFENRFTLKFNKIEALMESYNIPVYIGEFNSLIYFGNAKTIKEKCTKKSLPDCLKVIDTPLQTWEYEMKAYDGAGLSYTAWTYKAAGKYWQSLIYSGTKDKKVNLKEDTFEYIMKVFSRTSKDGSNENTLYKNMFEKHFKDSKP